MANVELRIRTRLVGNASRMLQADAAAIHGLQRTQTSQARAEARRRLAVIRGESALAARLRKESERSQTSSLGSESQKRIAMMERARRTMLAGEKRFVAAMKALRANAGSLALGGMHASGRMAGRLRGDVRSMSSLPALIGGGVAAAGVGGVLKSTFSAADEVRQAELRTRLLLRGDEDRILQVNERARAIALESPTMGIADATKGMQTGLRLMNNDVAKAAEVTRLASALQSLDPTQGFDGALFALKELESGDAMSLRSRFGFRVNSDSARERLKARGLSGPEMEREVGRELIAMLQEELDELYGSGQKGQGVTALLASQLETLDGQFSRIKSVMSDVVVALGEPLIDSVVGRLTTFNEGLLAFRDTPKYTAMIQSGSQLIGKAADTLLSGLEKLPAGIERLYDGLQSERAQENFEKLTDLGGRLYDTLERVGSHAMRTLPAATEIFIKAMDGAKPTLSLLEKVIQKMADLSENPAVVKMLGVAGTAYVFNRATGGLLQEAGGALLRRGIGRAGKGAVGGAAGDAAGGLLGANIVPVRVTNWHEAGSGLGGGAGGVDLPGRRGRGRIRGRGFSRGRGLAQRTLGRTASRAAGRGLLRTAGQNVLRTAVTTGGASIVVPAAVGGAVIGAVGGGLYALGRAGNPTPDDVKAMRERGRRFMDRGNLETMTDKQVERRVAQLRRQGQHAEAERVVQRRAAIVNAPIQVASPTVNISGTPSEAQLEEVSRYFDGPFRDVIAKALQRVIDEEARRNGV